MKLSSIISRSTQILKEQHIDDFTISSEEIIAHILGYKRLDLFLHLEDEIALEDIRKIDEAIKKRATHYPLQYILGYVDFYGCRIDVNPSVLIPRKETEQLVDLAIKEIKPNSKVLDLCTGSGCIAISLKKYRPDLDVYASDISHEALIVAKKNAKMNGVSVDFRKGDLLEPFAQEKFDVVISNPPYVSENEYKLLEKEIYFEPKSAFIAQNHGFAIYQKISEQIQKKMNIPGKIFLEIMANRGNELKKIFYFAKSKILFDLSGKERFIFLEIE